MASIITRRTALAGLAGSVATFVAPAARAADKLRVGKSVVQNFGFIPLDVGMSAGIFAQHGLDIEELNFNGGAKLAQAVTAGAVDISLSAGPEMAFVAKGAPEIAVGSISSSPSFMGMNVGADAKGSGIDALKGQTIGITSAGSLTQWLVNELNRVKGWSGTDSAVPVVIGGSGPGQVAAIKTKAVFAVVAGVTLGFELEEQHEGHVLVDCSSFVNNLELYTTFASNDVIARNPDAVRRFLKAWYETVAYMKQHKPETVAATSKVIGFTQPVSERTYDALLSKLSTDGSFAPSALAALSASFVDLGVLKPPIDMSKLYTEKFLPKG
ncbi:MAG TPA: ABC transporter substrate-binding protein [Stellaceae bacterium]|jgi:ABC-type nitrate/sulfonate/bicarbonate transport system substrate-binding protein|nr:ABC transporter substrate-binding protein [Stellaceae bacterium]